MYTPVSPSRQFTPLRGFKGCGLPPLDFSVQRMENHRPLVVGRCGNEPCTLGSDGDRSDNTRLPQKMRGRLRL